MLISIISQRIWKECRDSKFRPRRFESHYAEQLRTNDLVFLNPAFSSCKTVVIIVAASRVVMRINEIIHGGHSMKSGTELVLTEYKQLYAKSMSFEVSWVRI